MTTVVLSGLTGIVLAGAGLGIALVWLYRLALPAGPNLAREVAAWEQSRAAATARRSLKLDPHHSEPVGLQARLGQWAGDRLRARVPARVAQLGPDLAITQTTLEAWVATCVGTLGVAFAGSFALVGFLGFLGLALPLPIAPIGGVVLVAVTTATQIRDLRAHARTRREDFRRGLWIYHDLVAMSLEAGRGHPDALPAAARICQGWVFDELNDAIDLAPTYGETAWEALGRLGERYGIVELIDLRGTLMLAHHDGATIRATLVARADTMREARITEAHARATNATETMSIVTILMAIVVVVFIVFPQVMNLYTA